MAIFEWDDSLSVGDEKIDAQHRELIKRIDVLAQHILQEKGREKIHNTLSFMIDYGDVHFSTEEEQMAGLDYPGFEEHKKQHEMFREITEKMKRDLDSKEDTEFLASSVQRFLIDWLILHIKNEDMAFGEFLKEKG
jgi:hemerythrin